MNINKKSSYSKIKDQLKNSELDRTYSLWNVGEDEELLRLYTNEKLTNLEISKKLRRTLGSINSRLKLHGHPNKNVSDFSTQFIDYIKDGINPITGEILGEDSAWRHPKILEDLQTYIGIPKIINSQKNKYTGTEINGLIDKERLIFAELMIQVKKFLPKVSDRDSQLLTHYYNQSGQKKTLQDTALHFGISRERVRQIRDKSLRKIRWAIKNRNFIYSKATSVKSINLDKKNSLLYLNDILDIIVSKDNFSKPSQNLTQIKNNLPKHDFFKIENFDTFTPFSNSNQISRDQFTDEEITKQRQLNLQSGRLLNSRFPITWEEVEKMREFFELGHNANQLEKYFQRSHKSIYSSLEKANYFNISQKNVSSQIVKESSAPVDKYRKSLLWKDKSRFTERQIEVVETIYNNSTGISFHELCSKLSLSTPQLQGILGAITSRWRNLDKNNDRMWKMTDGKYIPLDFLIQGSSILEKNAYAKKNINENSGKKFCIECGLEIDNERIKKVPTTLHCIDCASEISFERRRIFEPLGTREDFKKDKNSWKKTNF